MGLESLLDWTDPINWIILVLLSIGFVGYLLKDDKEDEPKKENNNDDEDEMEDDEEYKCNRCNKDLKKEQDYFKCVSCGKDYCYSCIVEFLEPDSEVVCCARICKKCIDKAYPREKEIVEKKVYIDREEPKEEKEYDFEKDF